MYNLTKKEQLRDKNILYQKIFFNEEKKNIINKFHFMAQKKWYRKIYMNK